MWLTPCRSRRASNAVEQLLELGALSYRTLLAHCVWVSEKDHALLAAARVHVRTRTSSSARAFASLLHKASAAIRECSRPAKFSTWDARGAVALDLPVGAIVPGMKADLALVRLDGFHVQPTRSSPAWSTRRVVPTWRWLWSGPRGGEGRTPRRHALGRLERARPPGRARASGIYVTRGSACARKNGRELRPDVRRSHHPQNTILRTAGMRVRQRPDAEIVASACALFGAFDLAGCNCPMCPGAIYWALFRGIYYANRRAEASQIGFDGEFIFGEVRAPNNRHRAAIDCPKRA